MSLVRSQNRVIHAADETIKAAPVPEKSRPWYAVQHPSFWAQCTLNVLLSFAQFEREVTAERIRDKVAASKHKGMWMGGAVPSGYDARNKALVVNPGEARAIQAIFKEYLALGSVRPLSSSHPISQRNPCAISLDCR